MTPPAAGSAPATRWETVLQVVLLPAILTLAWQVWAMTLSTDPRAPAPARVVTSFIDLVANGGLVGATLQSLGRVVLGFICALVSGVVLGLLMGSNRAIRDFFDPIVESFRPIAPMAILPVAILWFGTGTGAALAIVTYAAFFPLLVNTVHGVMRVERKLVLAAMTMGVPRSLILTKVVLPAAMPSILLGSRLAMGVAWTAIIAAELGVGAKSGGGTSGGIGQMMFIFYAYNVDLNAIVVCMIVVGVVALCIDRLFRFAEHRLMPWRH
jgi:ABC-type nitrate/sulfonate/bicarbonate transport system permease component